MNFAVALAPLLAGSAFAQSITREVTYSETELRTISLSPGIVSNVMPSGSAFANPRVAFDLPSGDGVEVTGLFTRAQIRSGWNIQLRGVAPGLTRVQGSVYNSLASTGVTTSMWGPTDFVGGLGSWSAPDLAPGVIQDVVLLNGFCQSTPAPCNFQANYSPTMGPWSVIVNDPRLSAIASTSELSFDAFDPTTFQSVDVEILQADGYAEATVEVAVELELDAQSLSPYCPSPAGSTGVPSTLSAYGSIQAESAYLTIRAEDLPMGQFAILLFGTEPAQRPFGFATVCVGGTVSRASDVMLTGSGTVDFEIDLVGRVIGETIYTQAMYRDTGAPFGAPFGTTGGASFVVAP